MDDYAPILLILMPRTRETLLCLNRGVCVCALFCWLSVRRTSGARPVSSALRWREREERREMGGGRRLLQQPRARTHLPVQHFFLFFWMFPNHLMFCYTKMYLYSMNSSFYHLLQSFHFALVCSSIAPLTGEEDLVNVSFYGNWNTCSLQDSLRYIEILSVTAWYPYLVSVLTYPTLKTWVLFYCG